VQRRSGAQRTSQPALKHWYVCRSGAAYYNADIASHAARCVARHGVRSHPVPVALVGECSMSVV
jgi:hypothetical protein